MKLTSLKKRQAFIKAHKTGQNISTKGLILQIVKTIAHEENHPVKIGLTVSKKVGKATVRNRVKRRLRSLATQTLLPHASTQYYYVIIGKRSTINRTFKDLQKDLKYAMHTLKCFTITSLQ